MPLPDIGIFRRSQISPSVTNRALGGCPPPWRARDPTVRRWIQDTIAIPPLAKGYNRREDLPQFPLGDVQRDKIARVFAGGQQRFPEAEINPRPRRAAAAFCLPARCGVGVPPWATASRKCLAVLIGGWEPSLLQVTTV